MEPQILREHSQWESSRVHGLGCELKRKESRRHSASLGLLLWTSDLPCWWWMTWCKQSIWMAKLSWCSREVVQGSAGFEKPVGCLGHWAAEGLDFSSDWQELWGSKFSLPGYLLLRAHTNDLSQQGLAKEDGGSSRKQKGRAGRGRLCGTVPLTPAWICYPTKWFHNNWWEWGMSSNPHFQEFPKLLANTEGWRNHSLCDTEAWLSILL